MKNPEKYGWDPKWLLSHLIDIYLHLDSEALVTALANDQVGGRQPGPLSLVEECRGLTLIGRDLQSVAGASSLMP